MIKFFRKIRQKLLSENKLSRYLLYAIGEIILVVIGILIALNVNNQNILKKETQLERQYKNRLINQFQQDSVFLTKFNKSMEFITPFIDKIDSLLIQLDNNLLNPTDIVKIPVFLTLQSQFVTKTTAIEELNNTGNMSLLKSTELKDALVSYQNAVSKQLFMINNTATRNNEFDNYLIQYGVLKKRFYDIEVKYLNNEFRNRYWFVIANRKEFKNTMTDLENECINTLKLLRQ